MASWKSLLGNDESHVAVLIEATSVGEVAWAERWMPEPWRSAHAACVARCLHEKREPGVLWRTEVGELPMGTAALEQLRELLGHNQVAPVAKNPPASAEDAGNAVPSLGWEDPLEDEMATHSSILAQRIPWTEGPGGL